MTWYADKKNTSTRIVMASLLIWVVFVLFLLFHLKDVRDLFFENAKEALLGHTEAGTALVHRNVERLKEMSAECEVKLQNRDGMVSISTILADEQYDNPGYEYSFLDEKSCLYRPNGRIKGDAEQKFMDEMYSFEYRDDFLCITQDNVTEDGEIAKEWLGIRRVTEGNSIGYLMISSSAEGLFEQEMYDYLTGLATCFLIDKNGNVLVAEKGYEDEIADNDNFYELMKIHADYSNEVERRLEEMRRDLIAKENGSFTLSLGGDKDCFVVFQKVRGTKDVFFVSCFHDEVLDDMVNDVLNHTFIFAMLLFVFIMGILFFTWKREMDSSALIEKLAYEDSVTGGRNLNYFKRSSETILSESREVRFCVYRFDIVRFRYINEAYGHNRADQVLAACIEEFRKIYSKKEICVRITSDQFLALVLNDETVETRYRNYLKAVGDRAIECGVKYPIRFRMGIYQVHKDDMDIDIMIDHANVARKSLTGEEKVLEAVYSDYILAGMKKINDIESIMQQSLNQGEFKIYLQPKWNIVNDTLIGAEALARWVRTDGSVIYPSDFIPVFENNGFIEKLDFYMLENLCMHMREYRMEMAYNDIDISINQSRILILNPDYVKNVEKLLKRYQIPVDKIELEITETVFFDEKEKVVDIVNQLKKIGVRLAMDDFGSGYSSLNILKDVPFDVLKIDREFFSETNTSLTSILILEKIVEMAKGLGLRVICEGVETEEQVEVLRNLGCEWVQGYYYGRPIPIEEFYEKYCRIEE